MNSRQYIKCLQTISTTTWLINHKQQCTASLNFNQIYPECLYNIHIAAKGYSTNIVQSAPLEEKIWWED